MKKKQSIFVLAIMGAVWICPQATAEAETRSISVEDYIDKMKGGWVGQMVGVSWGAPTEFDYLGVIMPEGAVPVWQSGMINDAFGQDDLYVEMTFLRSLELCGLDVSIVRAGCDFANSSYELWHANYAGRNNLRSGVIPPNSGHPQYNNHADDIDYQIEADYSGLISPGLPNSPIELGEKFGRLMNYGDGVYAGQFIGGMYAEAFFETDMETVVRAGLECIPQGSQYYECVNDVLTWYGADPNWKNTWQLINNKYHLDPNYRRFSCSGAESDFNIDAKINGAYVVMGLLYGNGDPNNTITISMRCGQDSDCNPSSAAGILFTSMGYSNVPSRFKSALNESTYFSYTDYNFPLLMNVCEGLARQVVVQAGGSIEDDPCNPGEDIFVVSVSTPVPSALLQSWDPDPPINPILPYFLSDLNGDCVVDYNDLEALARDWLMSGGDINAVEPNEPVGRWSFDTDGGSGSNANNSGSLGGSANGTLVNMNNPDWVSPGASHPNRADPNYALDFDGTNDYVDIPDFNSIAGGFTTNTLTISAWIRRDGNQADFAGIMYSTRHGAGWGDSVVIAGISMGGDADWANWTQNKLLYHWDDDVGWWLEQEMDFTVPDGVWTFCAVSVEPTQATLYMMPDGATMISEILYETHIETTFDQRWTIGMDERDFDAARNFKGLIDDVRIFDYALSAAEICYVAEGAGGSCYQPVNSSADIDDSDNVDFKDYVIMANNWLAGF